MDKDSKIYIAGHRGLVGSALYRCLNGKGYKNIVVRSHRELDLTDQKAVADLFESERPDYVFLAAAKVGGILANSTYPADFLFQNLAIQTNVIHQSYLHGVKRLLFLGSSCIYPRDCPQPIKEEYLLTGPLEPTNEAYAIAKIAGIKMCQAYNRQYGTHYLAVMPTNIYGPNDNFDLATSHVMPALIRKFHEAQREGNPSVVVWGTGNPKREFLHSDDLANACFFLMNLEKSHFEGLLAKCAAAALLNIGCGSDLTIRDLVETIVDVVGFKGYVTWDASKPDGTPRKLIDTSHLNRLGWKPQISLRSGIQQVYRWFVDHNPTATALPGSR